MTDVVTPLVEIPNCTAVHVLSSDGDSSNTSVLGEGTLTLILASTDAIKPPPPGLNAPEQINVVCTLTVGPAAFPLYTSTLFGTLADEPNVYVFTPEIGGDKGSYVKVTLPPHGSGPAAGQNIDRFEEILIKYGLLKTGMAAVGDELGRGMRQNAAAATTAIREATARYTSQTSSSSEPSTFSDTTHSMAATVKDYTGAAASLASRATEAIVGAAGSAGAYAASNLPSLQTPSTAANLTTTSDTMQSSVDGIRSGATDVASSLSSGSSDITRKQYGEEAASLSDTVGGVLGDVGKVAMNVAAPVTTAVRAAAAGVQGAADAPEMRAQGQAAKVGTGGAAVNVDDAWKGMGVGPQ